MCDPCYPQGKPIDFVDVNEGNARWIQDFRMKSYASPAKLESIDGKGVTTGHCHLPCQGNGLLRARILGKSDTGKLCFERRHRGSCSCWFTLYLRGNPGNCFVVSLFTLEWSFSFNIYAIYTDNVCVVYKHTLHCYLFKYFGVGASRQNSCKFCLAHQGSLKMRAH